MNSLKMSRVDSTIEVHSLVCHRDLEMALSCLGSLLKFSAEPVSLVIHDDGSLTSQDKEKLLTHLTPSTIISRLEADELIKESLKNHQNCYKYRFAHEKDVWSLKLFDIALLSQGDIAYCDSDILFFRPFIGLFQLPNSETSALYMKDLYSSYSLPFWYPLKPFSIKLPSKSNAGLFFVSKKAYDIDFIDWFIGQDDSQYIFDFLEQTTWAALEYRASCRCWNPKQIAMINHRSIFNEQMVAGHFTRPYRFLIEKFHNEVAFTEEHAPVIVESIPSQDCNFLELAQEQARRQLGAVKREILKIIK